MRAQSVCAATLLATAIAGTAAAQQPPLTDSPRQPSIHWPIIGGVVAGAGGVLAGALVGRALDCADGCSGDFDGYGGVVIGGVVGEALLLPIGVHLGNGRRGSFAADLAGSILSTGGFLGFAALTGPDAVFFTPFVQLVTTVVVERRTAAARGRRRMQLGLVPTARGVAILGRIRLRK